MARVRASLPSSPRRFPHTRGDGPADDWGEGVGGGISPHPWGWPGREIPHGEKISDFPTPVGMARRASCRPRRSRMISPHPWGWPGRRHRQPALLHDFPTPVGMARRACERMSERLRFPHTRGDGPPLAFHSGQGLQISPHPWGWPGVATCLLPDPRDFPTPVGMARERCPPGCASYRFPHTRGDGPLVACGRSTRTRISPHPWGWPEITHNPSERQIDFPTPVGMARPPPGDHRTFEGFPHTRGDGPWFIEHGSESSEISPHPWGWPDARGRCETGVWDFPTPVGMARMFYPCRNDAE
ncbi:MAG: hypothetical protein RLZZ505_1172 [Verrucomicrobiota bacterium]